MWHVFVEVEQVRVVAQLAKDRDRLERLGFFALEEGLEGRRLHEELVEAELEGGETDEDDVFVFDRD